MALTLGGYAPSTPRQTPQQTNSFPKIVSDGSILTANNAVIPLVYGRVSVQGTIITQVVFNNILYIAVGWCYGEISGIERWFINDETPITGVESRHYRGTTTQDVDPWLQEAIPGYADDLVVRDRGYEIGVAYSVFKISIAAISGAPVIKAIIQGKLVDDPNAEPNSDPFYYDCVLNVDFQTGGADESPNNLTIVLSGDASIDSGGLQLTGNTDSYAYINQQGQGITAGLMTMELVATTTTLTGVSTLFARADRTGQNKSFKFDRNGDEIRVFFSSTGSTWDIADNQFAGNITTNEFKLTMERVAGEYVIYIDGLETARLEVPEFLAQVDVDWYFGTNNAGDDLWLGSIQAARITAGHIRYGAEHQATAKPFADSDSYGTRTIYSVNPALHWADFASSPIYGLGATVENVGYSALYCTDLLDLSCGDPQIERCQLGIAISANRPIEAWLNLLAQYANCIWYPWGENLRIQPDERITSAMPSGQDVVIDSSFEIADSPAWTADPIWVIGAGVASVNGTQTADSYLSQVVTVEAGVEYAASIYISDIAAGTIRVEIDGEEIIAAQSLPDTYTAYFVPAGATASIDVIADVNAWAIVSDVNLNRTYWRETEWVRDSLSVTGPSERGTPTSTKVNYTIPVDDDPNWLTGSTVQTSPFAESGELPFIQTVLDFPGVFRLGEANNKAVQRTQRMHNRYNVSYITTDHGILNRVGDAVQPVNAYRGIDNPVWVESVEMVEPGRYRVSGSKYDNLHFPDYCTIQFCSFAEEGQVLPSTSIYSEPFHTYTESMRTSAMIATDGDEIIAYPGERTILYSPDAGDTWIRTEFSLPFAPEAGSGHFLPTSWQKFEGMWYTHFIDTENSNTYGYIGRTLDGQNWEWSPAGSLYNDRYTRGSFYINEDGTMLFGGRDPSTNLVIWALYDDWQGSTSRPNTFLTGPNNQNSVALIGCANTTMAVVWNGSQHVLNTVASDASSRSYCEADNWGNELGNQQSNGINTVLINDGSTDILKWTPWIADGPLPTIPVPNITQTERIAIAWTGIYWVFSASSSTDIWELAHSEETDGENIQRGANVQLPTAQTSSGSILPKLVDIKPLTGGWFVGAYVKQSDSKMEIIKFQYRSC